MPPLAAPFSEHLSSSPGDVPRGSSSKYSLVLGVEIGATTTAAKGCCCCCCCCCTLRRPSCFNENCEDDDDDDDLPETRESDPGNGDDGASPPCASSSLSMVMDVCSPERGGIVVVVAVGVWRLRTVVGGEEAGMLRLPRETGLPGGGLADLWRGGIGGDGGY